MTRRILPWLDLSLALSFGQAMAPPTTIQDPNGAPANVTGAPPVGLSADEQSRLMPPEQFTGLLSAPVSSP